MFGVVQRSVPIVVLCVYVCLVVDQELHKIDMAVLTGPVLRCPTTVGLCIEVCSPVEELRHYIQPAKMSSPVRRRLTVIEYRCTNSHLLAQPFRNVQMSVQDRHIEGREAGVVLPGRSRYCPREAASLHPYRRPCSPHGVPLGHSCPIYHH